MNELKQFPIPNDWKWTTIGKIMNTYRNNVEPKDSPEELFNYLSIENIESNTGNLVKFSPTEGKKIQSAKLRFSTSDVLISKLRPYLNKVLVPDFSGISATDLIPLRPINEDIERKYVAAYLRWQKVVRYLSSRMRGEQLPRVSTGDILKISIPLPPILEQQRIAKKIDYSRNQIVQVNEELDNVLSLMRTFRRTVLLTAFQGRLIPSIKTDTTFMIKKIDGERKKLTSSEIDESPETEVSEINDFVDEISSNIPKHWSLMRLENICYKITNGGTPSTSVKNNFDPNGIPLIKVENVLSDGRVVLSEKQLRISKEAHDKQSRSKISTNDVLVNVVGPPVGKIGLVTSEMNDYNINQGLVLLRCVPSYNPKLLWYCLMSPWYYELMTRLSKGVRQLHIRKSSIAKIPIPVMPIKEQDLMVHRIVELFKTSQDVEDVVYSTKNRINSIEQSILTSAFHGKL